MIKARTVRIKDTCARANILYNFSEYTAKLAPRLWEEWEICPKKKLFRKCSKRVFEQK